MNTLPTTPCRLPLSLCGAQAVTVTADWPVNSSSGMRRTTHNENIHNQPAAVRFATLVARVTIAGCVREKAQLVTGTFGVSANRLDEETAIARTASRNLPTATEPSGSVNISESARLNDGTAFKYSADSCTTSNPAALNGGGRKSLIKN